VYNPEGAPLGELTLTKIAESKSNLSDEEKVG